MKYKVGDKVRIKSLDWYNENKDDDGIVELSTEDFVPGMSQFCGKIVTIEDIDDNVVYYMEGTAYGWTDEMIEGLVEEETKPKFKVGDIVYNNAFDEYVRVTSIDGVHCYVQGLKDNATHYSHINNLIPCSEVKTINIAIEETINDISDKVTDTIMGQPMNGNSFNLPQGYQFVDENGNVINATKIVLEKKKKEYPKTLGECRAILGIMSEYGAFNYKANLITTFMSLLICRDAYWKIAGEEMGLGKPWEPDWTYNEEAKYCIGASCSGIEKYNCGIAQYVLAFPTKEMRDAFYENFKELIEQCKELL